MKKLMMLAAIAVLAVLAIGTAKLALAETPSEEQYPEPTCEESQGGAFLDGECDEQNVTNEGDKTVNTSDSSASSLASNSPSVASVPASELGSATATASPGTSTYPPPSASASASASAGSASALPKTGGAVSGAEVLAVGSLLLAGGLLARRIVR